MNAHCRFPRPARLFLPILIMMALFIEPTTAAVSASRATRTLLPIGSGYIDATLQRFAQIAAQHDTSGTVYLLVIPAPFSSDPFTISAEERAQNLSDADRRRQQVQTACDTIRQTAQTCQATLAPILVRDDAFDPANLSLFTPDLDGVYILGGDQTVAMRVLADTPTERLMRRAYNDGAVVGGNSAGAAVQSRTMIAGYIGDNGPDNGLQQGSVEIWRGRGAPETERGLSFGLRNAVLDQHAFQRGRIGRLLNVTWEEDTLGIGVDAETGAVIEHADQITDVFGRSGAIVIDMKTYRAHGRYAGPTNSLAVRGVITHLIPPGGYGYDLRSRRPLVNGQPELAPHTNNRTFDSLRLLAGHGPLLLSGNISDDKGGSVTDRFVALSGESGARLVVLAAGYADRSAAQADAEAFVAALQPKVSAPVQAFVLDTQSDSAAINAALADASGILITAPDQSQVLSALNAVAPTITAIQDAWQRGATLLADNAAAAALGQLTTATAPRTDDIENESINSFRPDSVAAQPGLAFLSSVAIEPGLLPERRWGELYNLIYRDHSMLAIGVDVGTALEITSEGAAVIGTGVVVVLDGRAAQFAVGSNGALGARYVRLDSYVDGDWIEP